MLFFLLQCLPRVVIDAVIFTYSYHVLILSPLNRRLERGVKDLVHVINLNPFISLFLYCKTLVDVDACSLRSLKKGPKIVGMMITLGSG
jgi:hypothetical protein